MTLSQVRLLISILVIVALFGVLGISLFVPIKGFEVDIVDMLVGALVTAFAGVVGYYFKGAK